MEIISWIRFTHPNSYFTIQIFRTRDTHCNNWSRMRDAHRSIINANVPNWFGSHLCRHITHSYDSCRTMRIVAWRGCSARRFKFKFMNSTVAHCGNYDNGCVASSHTDWWLSYASLSYVLVVVVIVFPRTQKLHANIYIYKILSNFPPDQR